MTLPSALQPKALIEPCICGGKVFAAFFMGGPPRHYTLRSGVRMNRTLWRFDYCEDCKRQVNTSAVMIRKERNDPPVDQKVVQVLKMLRRGGWDPWKRTPTQMSEV